MGGFVVAAFRSGASRRLKPSHQGGGKMTNGEPGWTQGLPDGRTVDECSRAIDALEAVLCHYRRKRQAMQASVRLIRSQAAQDAGHRAMLADPVRKRAWMINQSLAARKRLPSMTDAQKSHYQILTRRGRKTRAEALEIIFPSAGAPTRADCGEIPSTAARSAGSSPIPASGARGPLYGR